MKYAAHLKRLGWLAGSYALLLLLLITTDPFRAPLLIVMIPFVLLFIALFFTINTVLNADILAQRLARQKRLFVAGAAAWLPVMLLILRSINQLTWRDGLILVIFILALLFYVSRTNLTRS
jgi:hypothetical protein